jgi:hypothetical protein
MLRDLGAEHSGERESFVLAEPHAVSRAQMKDFSQGCLHPFAAAGAGGRTPQGRPAEGSQDGGEQVFVDRFEREPLSTEVAASPNVVALAGPQAQPAATTLVHPWRHADN